MRLKWYTIHRSIKFKWFFFLFNQNPNWDTKGRWHIKSHIIRRIWFFKRWWFCFESFTLTSLVYLTLYESNKLTKMTLQSLWTCHVSCLHFLLFMNTQLIKDPWFYCHSASLFHSSFMILMITVTVTDCLIWHMYIYIYIYTHARTHINTYMFLIHFLKCLVVIWCKYDEIIFKNMVNIIKYRVPFLLE